MNGDQHVASLVVRRGENAITYNFEWVPLVVYRRADGEAVPHTIGYRGDLDRFPWSMVLVVGDDDQYGYFLRRDLPPCPHATPEDAETESASRLEDWMSLLAEAIPEGVGGMADSLAEAQTRICGITTAGILEMFERAAREKGYDVPPPN